MKELVVGIVTCATGVILVLRHLHVWRQETDKAEDEHKKRFLWNQLRRRVLTSTCIAVLGFVIGLFHFRDYWADRMVSWAILVTCALTLTVMIFFLAMFDMLAVTSAIRTDKESTNDAAKELAREYHRLKKKAAEQAADSSDSAAE